MRPTNIKQTLIKYFKDYVIDFYFRSRVGAQKHINKTHELSLKEYEAQFGSPLTKKVIHSCVICQKKVLHDPSCISYHVKCIHKITINDYFKNYIGDNKDHHELPKITAKTIKATSKTGKISSYGNPKVGKILKSVSRFKPSGNEPHFKW